MISDNYPQGKYWTHVQHGTAGIGASYGFARAWFGHVGSKWEGATETFLGPFATKAEAEAEADRINEIFEEYRQSQN